MSVNNIPYGTLRDIANELKNIRELLEKQIRKEEIVNSGDVMNFPNTWEEYEQVYGFEDKKQIYTNGSRLIQSYRVKQWLDHCSECGKWIDKDGWKFCSECDSRADEQANGVAIEPRCTNYCCECGAKMKGADQDSKLEVSEDMDYCNNCPYISYNEDCIS